MREPWTYLLQPFGCVSLDMFCLCVWDFYIRVASGNVVHTLRFNIFAATHMCKVFVLLSTDKKNQMWNLQNRRPCVVSTI